MKKLLRFVCPLIAGKTNCVPVAALPKPPEFCDTLIGATPGERVSNWVKLRPLRGRSTTCLAAITAPTSAVELCNNSPVASTLMVCVNDPSCSPTSIVAVWLTANVTRGTREVVKLAAETSRE